MQPFQYVNLRMNTSKKNFNKNRSDTTQNPKAKFIQTFSN